MAVFNGVTIKWIFTKMLKIMKEFGDIQRYLGYCFKDLKLLEKALRHSSLEPKFQHHHISERSFDRLEFLGDRVLNLFVAEILYKHFDTESEGDLAHRYTALVCYETCAEIAYKIGIDRFLEVANGTTFNDLRILCDALEAVLGAMYLDGGEVPCRRFVEQHWREKILCPVRPPEDSKSALQELAQARGKGLPIYTVEDKRGSEHAPTFVVSVKVDDYPVVRGTGQSKKAAEKMAAAKLLEIMHERTL